VWPGGGGVAVVTGRVEGAAPGIEVTLLRVADAVPDQTAGSTWRLCGYRYDDGPSATVNSGPDGAFRFTRVPEGEYFARVRGPRGEDVEQWVPIRPHQGSFRVRLEVQPPAGDARVAGRLVADGAPGGGARVTWSPWWTGVPRTPTTVRTGADGRFVIRGLADLDGTLTVSKDGAFSRLVVAPPSVDGGDVDAFADTTTVAVRVVEGESGAAVAGALVVARSDSSTHGATSGADGVAIVRCRNGNTRGLLLDVAAREFLPAAVRLLDVPQEFELQLRRDVPVAVRVVDAASGAPAAGARVMAHSVYAGGRALAVADADGRALLRGLAPGDVRVYVVGNGWVSAAPRYDGIDVGVPLTASDFETAKVGAVRSVAVRGRVRGADGQPVEGAIVFSSGGQYGHGPHPRPDDWGRAVTRADGSFVIEDLTPDAQVTVWASVPEAPGIAAQTVTPRAGGSDRLEFRAERGGFVRVLVVDGETGAPLENVNVGARVPAGRAARAIGAASASTDANGCATLGPLPAGTCDVQVDRAPGMAGKPVETDVLAGVTSEEVRVAAPHTESIVCTLVDELGRAPEHAEVRISPHDEKRGVTYTTRHGRFSADGLRAGSYDLDATGRLHGVALAGRATVTTGGEPVILRLGPTDARPQPRRIRVVGPDGRHVVAAAWSLHQEEDGGSGGVAADGFVLRSVSSGALLEVWDACDASGAPAGLGGSIVPVPEDGVVHLGREHVVTGVVRDAAGAPVAGILVTATPVDPRVSHPSPRHGPHEGGWGGQGRALTARDGTFTIRGLGSARYAVVARPSHRFDGSPPVQTDAGGSVALVVNPGPPR
jgi:protocatechuate 3,4-dioxygenase beta subunit